jgi:hypothetical protein
VGLYSEEIGLPGGHISTCPQSFHHSALAHAAVPLDEAFDGQAPAPPGPVSPLRPTLEDSCGQKDRQRRGRSGRHGQ